MESVWLSACILVVLLVSEALVIRKSVSSISTRIHVNGTRGKSSVTAYIATALRASGLRVMGKVTGEIPAMILTDGTRKTIRRRGPARIQEQFRTIHRAARSKAQALVLECMSIAPELQETESRFFKPQIVVLCNIRDDHREKMGLTRKEQIASICRSIPRGCILITNDMENLDAIRSEGARKKCRLVVAPGIIPEETTVQFDGGLPAGIFPENISLAVEAAVQAGISRQKAMDAILEEIWKRRDELSSPGTLKRKVPFLNAFAVNDPSSATAYLDRWRKQEGIEDRMILIFNTRSDRPLRTDLFVEWIMERKEQLSGVYITGDHRSRAYLKLKILKPSVEIYPIGPRKVRDLFQQIIQSNRNPSLIVGIGNIRGEGFRIIKEFEV